MSFVKGTIHVSILNNYMDFYKESTVDKIESSFSIRNNNESNTKNNEKRKSSLNKMNEEEKKKKKISKCPKNNNLYKKKKKRRKEKNIISKKSRSKKLIMFNIKGKDKKNNINSNMYDNVNNQINNNNNNNNNSNNKINSCCKNVFKGSTNKRNSKLLLKDELKHIEKYHKNMDNSFISMNKNDMNMIKKCKEKNHPIRQMNTKIKKKKFNKKNLLISKQLNKEIQILKSNDSYIIYHMNEKRKTEKEKEKEKKKKKKKRELLNLCFIIEKGHIIIYLMKIKNNKIQKKLKKYVYLKEIYSTLNMSNKETYNNLNEQNKSEFIYDDLKKVRQQNKCDNKLYKMNFKSLTHLKNEMKNFIKDNDNNNNFYNEDNSVPEILSDDYIILNKKKSNQLENKIYNNVINHRYSSEDIYLNPSKLKENNNNLVNSYIMKENDMDEKKLMSDIEKKEGRLILKNVNKKIQLCNKSKLDNEKNNKEDNIKSCNTKNKDNFYKYINVLSINKLIKGETYLEKRTNKSDSNNEHESDNIYDDKKIKYKSVANYTSELLQKIDNKNFFDESKEKKKKLKKMKKKKINSCVNKNIIVHVNEDEHEERVKKKRKKKKNTNKKYNIKNESEHMFEDITSINRCINSSNSSTYIYDEQLCNGVINKDSSSSSSISSSSSSGSISNNNNNNNNSNNYIVLTGNGQNISAEEISEYITKQGLNLKEYLIWKEIKIKESKELIHLNLDSSFSVSKGAGLYNYGQNICFFNSIIQAIIRIPYICKDLLNKLHSINCEKRKKKTFCFYCLFEQFACNIISKKSVIKNVLIPYIKKYMCNSYHIGYQEDVHEYLRYFLNSLEKTSFFSSIYIQKMFTGVSKNVTICMNCNNVSLKYEQYYELSLDISSCNNLEDALKHFLSKEMLAGENGYYCEKCKKKKKATKQCVINKLPRVLTIQIKRFFMNSNFDIVKNHKNISYPLYLDMKYYVNNYDLFENNFNNNVISLYEKMNKTNCVRNTTNGNNKKYNKIYHENSSCNIKYNDHFVHANYNNREQKILAKQKFSQQNIRPEHSFIQKNINYKNDFFLNNINKKRECSNDDIISNINKNEEDIFFNNKENEYMMNEKCINTTNQCIKLRGGNDNINIIHVLKIIENILIDLKENMCKKQIQNKLTSKGLRNMIREKKKLLIKELKKIKFSKLYKDISLRISKDIDMLYYYFKINRENDQFKKIIYKYKIDYYEYYVGSTNINTDFLNYNHNFDSPYKDYQNTPLQNNDENNNRHSNVNFKEENMKNSNKKNNYFSFELTGLIKHIGSGTDYGHYIALTKSNNNIYLQCDDNHISYINRKDILNCVKNAYIFIYTCINPEFIDFYNKYVDVLEKKNFDINLPVFEKRIEFKERITMTKEKFINKSLCY
ncbi:ubiquitin carboxyl-terminal hydrolase, putative [Plasmodium sp. gorilla clade G3]|nr:ubiquitin carboxyl-terminal hydrolase, putative [Plasmodium sp. gorilla clade G3]